MTDTINNTSSTNADALIRCDNVVRIYKTAELEAVALQGLDLEVYTGEMIAVVGASGSGKSTLLNILGGIDAPTAGQAQVAGLDLLRLSERERVRYRRRVVGFVWQQTARNLLPFLTALDNVALPMVLDGRSRRASRSRAHDLLSRVGLADRTGHRPLDLSGGEQQRVAIAVAIANEPQVLLADEPTGELDSETAREVIDVLREINREEQLKMVLVTHDPLISDRVTRTVSIRDGRTSSEVLRSDPFGDPRSSQEYAVLDRAGRLQLPREYLEALDMRQRVRLTLDPDHINVWPGADDGDS
ncbi:MAG: ABC transporter ATP-binding protein [Acidimicrobiales bacterium]